MIIHHIKTSYRNLLKKKIYALINILGLSIGIAGVILIGLYVKFETSYDMYFKDSDRIHRVALHRVYPTRTKDWGTSAIKLATVLRENYPQVEEATRLHKLYYPNEILVTIRDTEEDIQNQFYESRFYFADSLFFDVFDHKFIHGDPATALDDAKSVVLTRSTALRYFGTDEVLGRTINAPGALQITGVIEDIPDNSHMHFDILGSMSWLRFLQAAIRNDDWTSIWVYTYVKLKEGADPQELESQFERLIDHYGGPSISSNLGPDWKESGHAFEYFLQPLTSIHLHSHLDVELEPNGNISYIYILSAIALFILLISSINYINLSVARSSERAKEIGIRKVLGSFRRNVIHRILVESILICLISSILSIALLYLFIPKFNYLLGTYLNFNSISNPAIMFGSISFILTIGVLAGLYPAITLASLNPATVLKGSFKSSRRGIWLRNTLFTFQFFISIVMISGSLVANKQMRYLIDKDLGFEEDNVLVIHNVGLVADSYQAFKNELEKIPEVRSIGNASRIPGQFHSSSIYAVSDPEIPDIRANFTNVDDDYINTLQFEIVKGRGFSKEFSDSQSIIVNESSVEAMGVENPLGYKFMSGNDPSESYTIVGVVKDFNFYSLHSEVSPMVLFNISPGNTANLSVVRINSKDVSGVIKKIRGKWLEFTDDKFTYSFLDKDIQRQYEADQKTASLFRIFTYLAIIMSCVGLFGLATYLSNQRGREMSIRKVFGASIPQIMKVFSKGFLILTGFAFLLGVPITYFIFNKWLSNFAYHVDINILVFIISGIVTIVLVMLSVSYQAIKIAFVDPVEMLRNE